MIAKRDIQDSIIQAVNTVKRTNPMAGSITNTVTINFVANAQLAVGVRLQWYICLMKVSFWQRPEEPCT